MCPVSLAHIVSLLRERSKMNESNNNSVYRISTVLFRCSWSAFACNTHDNYSTPPYNIYTIRRLCHTAPSMAATVFPSLNSMCAHSFAFPPFNCVVLFIGVARFSHISIIPLMQSHTHTQPASQNRHCKALLQHATRERKKNGNGSAFVHRPLLIWACMCLCMRAACSCGWRAPKRTEKSLEVALFYAPSTQLPSRNA